MKSVNPRHGSMQFWPRVRAKKSTPRRRSWANSKEAKPLGFLGFKSGMAHAMTIDNRPKALTKGEQLATPITLVECPPMKVAGVVFYTASPTLRAQSCVLSDKLDKELARTIALPKTSKSLDDIKEFDDLRLLVYTQPKLTGIGTKKPKLTEIALGGSKDDKLAYAKEKLGSEITVDEIFKPGQQLDVHAITKGKGFQGPVKIFGIGLTNHKSEKARRTPGSLGPWNAQAHWQWRVAYAMKQGYHLRTEYNKWLLNIEAEPSKLNRKGGLHKYGELKNPTLLIKGSLPGPRKGVVSLTQPIRPHAKIPKDAPQIVEVVQ